MFGTFLTKRLYYWSCNIFKTISMILFNIIFVQIGHFQLITRSQIIFLCKKFDIHDVLENRHMHSIKGIQLFPSFIPINARLDCHLEFWNYISSNWKILWIFITILLITIASSKTNSINCNSKYGKCLEILDITRFKKNANN